MRRLFGLVFALVICLALVGAVVSTANAQTDPKDPVPVVPPVCQDVSRVDLNKDGKLDSADFELWVQTVHESGRCQLDGPLGECPAWVDVNRDGIVSLLDLDELNAFLLQCVLAPWRTQIG